MDIISVIGGIMTNIFSNDLHSGSLKFVERIRLRHFQKRISKWLRRYIINHDGSILTKSDFERFLTNDKPLERMFLSISGNGDSLPKNEFIENELKRFNQGRYIDRATQYQ